MRRWCIWLTVAACVAWPVGCGDDDSESDVVDTAGDADTGGEVAADADADADADPDTAADADADPDTAADADADGDEDTVPPPAGRVIDHTCTDLGLIPEAAINDAKSSLHVVYQHTSHGSQLITGMDALQAFPELPAGRYRWSDAGSDPTALDLDDLGIPADAPDLSQGDWVDAAGDTPWVVGTRALLDDPANAHVNVVLWSWCSINGHDAQRYVDNMEKLVAEYPEVTFVFMTGHSEGQGEDLTENGIHYNNELIRRHCREHGRWLFDFADIEAHNPDGEYFWDRAMTDNLDYDGGNWAVQWIAANPASELARLTTGEGVTGYSGCSGCAHSDSPPEANLNCVLKGRGAWWLFARLAGWSGE